MKPFIKIGPYRIEVSGAVFRMVVQRCNMASSLVPLTMVVVGHDCDPVEVTSKHWHVIASVYDLLVRRHGR